MRRWYNWGRLAVQMQQDREALLAARRPLLSEVEARYGVGRDALCSLLYRRRDGESEGRLEFRRRYFELRDERRGG